MFLLQNREPHTPLFQNYSMHIFFKYLNNRDNS